MPRAFTSLLVAYVVPALLVLSGCAPAAPATGAQHEVDVAVPMRDGVVLRAAVLRPRGPGPFPTLVYRTPYGVHATLE